MSTTIMTETEFNNRGYNAMTDIGLEGLTDVKSYVDLPKLNRKLKVKGVKAIYVWNYGNMFKNISNKSVKYKYPTACREDDEHAYSHPTIPRLWVSDYAIGDVIVVIKGTKCKHCRQFAQIEEEECGLCGMYQDLALCVHGNMCRDGICEDC